MQRVGLLAPRHAIEARFQRQGELVRARAFLVIGKKMPGPRRKRLEVQGLARESGGYARYAGSGEQGHAVIDRTADIGIAIGIAAKGAKGGHNAVFGEFGERPLYLKRERQRAWRDNGKIGITDHK